MWERACSNQNTFNSVKQEVQEPWHSAWERATSPTLYRHFGGASETLLIAHRAYDAQENYWPPPNRQACLSGIQGSCKDQLKAIYLTHYDYKYSLESVEYSLKVLCKSTCTWLFGGAWEQPPRGAPWVLSDILFRLGLIANALTQCSA